MSTPPTATATQDAVISTSTPSQSSSLTSDPLLSAFLAQDFSPSDYLNRNLPQLSVNGSTSSGVLSQTKDEDPLPLANVHSKANTLLSTLDASLNKSQATLTTLTDDILRATPRLGYEVEVLRSDVISLAENLTSPTTLATIAGLTHDEQHQHVNGDQESGSPIDRSTKGKPEVLKKLETLVKVRGHLEEVIKIFGEAMDWTLSAPNSGSTALSDSSSSSNNNSSLLQPFQPIIRSTTPNSMSGSAKIEQDISYLITNNELDKASAKIEELVKLCAVWKDTAEYATRMQFLEGLKWKIIEAGKGLEETYDEEVPTQGRDENGNNGDGNSSGLGGYAFGGDPGREGYYGGLLNQFQARMRGMG